VTLVADPRYCSNCRAEVPVKATECLECGVYAGDLFDERSLRPRTRMMFVFALLIVIAGVVAFFLWQKNVGHIQTRLAKRENAQQQSAKPMSTRVVGDRPGGARRAAHAAINEAEATRLLRRHLVTTKSAASSCIALLSHGSKSGDYYFSAVNSCDQTRLGRWRVDGKSGEASLAK
jgi:ribosomal protein L40E